MPLVDRERLGGEGSGARGDVRDGEQPARRAMDEVAGPERREQLERERDDDIDREPPRAVADRERGERAARDVLDDVPAPIAAARVAPRGDDEAHADPWRDDERAGR
jgi:hypothetical protein